MGVARNEVKMPESRFVAKIRSIHGTSPMAVMNYEQTDLTLKEENDENSYGKIVLFHLNHNVPVWQRAAKAVRKSGFILSYVPPPQPWRGWRVTDVRNTKKTEPPKQ